MKPEKKQQLAKEYSETFFRSDIIRSYVENAFVAALNVVEEDMKHMEDRLRYLEQVKQAQLKRIEELKEQTRWRPASEPPTEMTDIYMSRSEDLYLRIKKEYVIYAWGFYDFDNHLYHIYGNSEYSAHVTHWMPIPEV